MQSPQMIENAVRKIRQRIYELPEHKQDLATKAIGTLKSRLPAPPKTARSDYHWMYAAE